MFLSGVERKNVPEIGYFFKTKNYPNGVSLLLRYSACIILIHFLILLIFNFEKNRLLFSTLNASVALI